MLHEVETAVKFLTDFLRSKSNQNSRQQLKKEQVDAFAENLRKSLINLFQGHWHPAQPMRGSGYRCIINQSANATVDPMLLCVGRGAGIPEFLLRRYLPVEMAVWIDPNDVSYRIGEQGSICSLLGAEKENENGGRFHNSSSVSPLGGRSANSRTNSFSYSPEKATTSHQNQQQQQQQHQRQRLSPESLRQESTTTSKSSTTSTSTSSSKSQTEQSNDSGIELSPSTSPRPSAANTISNSSSPIASPLASPVREQPPAGMSTCKEQYASRPVGSFSASSSSVSPSKVGVAGIHVTPLSPLVR